MAEVRTGTRAVRSDDAVAEAMTGLRDLIRASDGFRQTVAEHFGIGLSEAIALGHLSIAGSLSARDLAGRLGLTPSAVTALMDRLEASGLAARAAHATDRRKIAVTLTEHGSELLKQVSQLMRTALDVLDDDQLPAAGATLSDLAASLAVQTTGVRTLSRPFSQ
jgi:DNA-binding MarR family transcriptional regulator